MGLFRKKKKIFGGEIEPNCLYCRYNMGEDQVQCPRRSEDGSTCKKYEYDPFKREPKGAPKLREYTADDFTL